MGHEEVAVRVRDLWLAGRHEEAAASIPTSVIDELASSARRRGSGSGADWRRSLLTTMLVHVPLDHGTLREVVELVLG